MPGGLPFGSGSTSALVDGLMALHAKRRHQVVVCLDASAFATAPVGVGCLDNFLTSAELAVKAGHQAQKFLASNITVFRKFQFAHRY